MLQSRGGLSFLSLKRMKGKVIFLPLLVVGLGFRVNMYGIFCIPNVTTFSVFALFLFYENGQILQFIIVPNRPTELSYLF